MASAQNKRVLALMRLPENSLCADCRAKDPRWASSKLGVFICINCSGIHRGLGTHITFVRSCTLDTWKPEEVDVMERVGNKKGNEYWEARLPPDFVRPRSEDVDAMSKFLRQKYELKKWVDPLMRPPQIPENIPWEPEPPKTYSSQPTDQFDANQMTNEAPRRRKKKKNTENQNFSDDQFNNNNMDVQDTNYSNSFSFTEAKNKMKNNKKKFPPQNNIQLEHENSKPSSDSLMTIEHPYNQNSHYSTDDDGFDPFSGKPLSKERNYNPDEDTDESDPTFADKLMGFIQNGIDFIKEKTKSMKKNSGVPSSSGKMSENPRIPMQESSDALHPYNSNRPRFNSFEMQQQQFDHQPPQYIQQFDHQQSSLPPPLQQQQQQPPQPQRFDNNQSHHEDLGRPTKPIQNAQHQDVFSLLSGSEVIIDDSLTDSNNSNRVDNETEQSQSNPFIGQMNNDVTKNTQKNDGFNPFISQVSQESNGQKSGVFNPFISQGEVTTQSNSKNRQPVTTATQDKSEESNDLLGLDFTSPTAPMQPSQPSSTVNDDLLSLNVPTVDQIQPQNQSAGIASDLLALDIGGDAASTTTTAQQPGSTGNSMQQTSSSDMQMLKPSAYDVFGRPSPVRNVGSGLGSLGLTPQQQQIAARAVMASQAQQRGSGSLTGFVTPQLGSRGSSGQFTSLPGQSPSRATNSSANRSGSQSSNDPFSGMNPF